MAMINSTLLMLGGKVVRFFQLMHVGQIIYTHYFPLANSTLLILGCMVGSFSECSIHRIDHDLDHVDPRTCLPLVNAAHAREQGG